MKGWSVLATPVYYAIKMLAGDQSDSYIILFYTHYCILSSLIIYNV